MMRRRIRCIPILLCLMLVGSFQVFGKKQGRDAIDSMLKDLSSPRYDHREDTGKVKLLVFLSWAYSGIDPDEQLKFGAQALKLTLKIHWPPGTAWAYGALGDYYSDISEFNKAAEFYRKDSFIASVAGLKSEQAAAISNIANVYLIRGNYQIALEYLFKSIKINEEQGAKQNLANDCSSVGMIFLNRGLYAKALEYLYRSLNIYLPLGSNTATANCYANIGLALEKQGYAAKANEYYRNSLLIDSAIDNTVGIVNSYDHLGKASQALGKLDMALEYYRKAFELAVELKNPLIVADCFSRLGDVLQQQKKITRALMYYDAAIKIYSRINNQSSFAITLNSMGDCYLDLYRDWDHLRINTADGRISGNSADSMLHAVVLPGDKHSILHVAKDLFLKSLQANRQLREFATMQFSYSGLCDISRYDNDFKRALEYADSSRAMHDSIYSFESREQILKIQLKNEFEQQHLADSLKHIQIVQKGYYELQRQKIVVNTSFLICLAVIFLGIISQRYRSVRKHAEQQSQIARQLLEIELKALRAQMNPHFVFNCLNSIQAFILRENKLEATEYLQKFSRLIRLILDNAQKTSNTIDDEAEILGLYLDLEQLRLKNKFEYSINIPDDIDGSFVEIPSMVIQPLVENSIWHGFTHSEIKGKISITFEKQSNKLICIVSDNGIGRKRSMEMKGKADAAHDSKGIKLIEDRLRVWSKINGVNYELQITDNMDAGSGTRTQITILYTEND